MPSVAAAPEGPEGKYVRLHEANVWADPRNGDIHLATRSPGFVGDGAVDTAGPGMRIVFSSNPRSANYHPRNFNRCVRALAAAGKPHPALIPDLPRELKDRPRVIEEVRRLLEEPVTAADLAVFGWASCRACGCVTDPSVVHVCLVASTTAPVMRRLEVGERQDAVDEAVAAGNTTATAVRRFLNDKGIACDRDWIAPLLATHNATEGK